MRILFLFQIFDFEKSTIYLDLVKECKSRGHAVSLIAGTSDTTKPLGVVDVEGIRTIYMRLPNQFGAGSSKKALIQMSIPGRIKQLLKDGFNKDKFDLIVYPTPPITLAPVLKYCKKHYKDAITYLMLKDIFPQNAVDLGMFSDSSPIYKYYRRLEKRLYSYSDRIGCMSEANIEYIKKHNPEIPDKKLEYFPNTAAVHALPEPHTDATANKDELRIVFGGNMGRPQDIEGLLAGIRSCGEHSEFGNVSFYFIGDGSESRKIEEFVSTYSPSNFTYSHQMPRDEYEQLVDSADAGLISLSASFTIPNFPSRLLPYMQKAKPVLAVVDEATDIDTCITEEAHCGYAVSSGSPEAFMDGIRWLQTNKANLPELGMNGRRYFEQYFNVGVSVDILERAYRG